MDHEAFKNSIDEYIDGALSVEKAAEFEAHLSSCAECAQIFEAHKDMVGRIKGLSVAPPEGLLGGALAKYRRKKRMRIRAAVTAAAAVLVIAVAAGVFFRGAPVMQKSSESAEMYAASAAEAPGNAEVFAAPAEETAAKAAPETAATAKARSAAENDTDAAAAGGSASVPNSQNNAAETLKFSSEKTRKAFIAEMDSKGWTNIYEKEYDSEDGDYLGVYISTQKVADFVNSHIKKGDIAGPVVSQGDYAAIYS